MNYLYAQKSFSSSLCSVVKWSFSGGKSKSVLLRISARAIAEWSVISSRVGALKRYCYLKVHHK